MLVVLQLLVFGTTIANPAYASGMIACTSAAATTAARPGSTAYLGTSAGIASPSSVTSSNPGNTLYRNYCRLQRD